MQGAIFMEQKQRKTDRRVIKTKKAIRTAFAKALSEKNIDKITIKDIADKADINRKTFYNYYDGVYQLVDEIEDELVSNLEEATKDLKFDDILRNPKKMFERIAEIMSSDLEFYGYLMKMDNNVHLAVKIITLMENKIKESVAGRRQVDPVKLDIAVNYAVTGMVSSFRNWFNSDRKLSLDEVSELVSELCVNGAAGLLADPVQ